MADQVTQILANAQSPDFNVRSDAERQLEAAEESNFAMFMVSSPPAARSRSEPLSLQPDSVDITQPGSVSSKPRSACSSESSPVEPTPHTTALRRNSWVQQFLFVSFVFSVVCFS